jgi:hypothetical protein
LHDHIVPVAHRRTRLVNRSLRRKIVGQMNDRQSLDSQVLDVVLFVLQTALLKRLESDILVDRRRELAARDGQVKERQVPTAKVIRQIARGQPDVALM